MNNKTIIITGVSDGLGLATAKKLLEKEYEVIGLSRSKPNDDRIDYIPLDLTNEKSIVEAAKQINRIGKRFCFINCAGVMADEDKIEMGEIERVFQTNTTGPILLEQLIFETVKKTGSDIINIISTSATRGDVDQPIYSSSKWGLLGYTKSLTARLKSTPARAISFIPGGFISDMPKKIGRTIADPENWTPVEIIADELIKVVETSSRIEISEIIINRKSDEN
ncbi:hypothetical protein FACS189431_1630 [Alphaproteobacteria bacterium]|nr:hypothetical protein FACS189431_1630 [Alphaproteobacteria bacterium]